MPDSSDSPRGNEYLAAVLRAEIEARGGSWRGAKRLRAEMLARFGEETITTQSVANLSRQRTRPSARAIEQLVAVLGDRLDVRRIFVQ